MAKRSKKRTLPEEASPQKESKAYRSLKALVEKRADQVFSTERESFNAADILGIHVGPGKSDALPSPEDESPMTPYGPEKPTHGSDRPTHGVVLPTTGMVPTKPGTVKTVPETGGSGPDRGQSVTGQDDPTKVVVSYNKIQTTKNRIPGLDSSTPGVAQAKPGVGFERADFRVLKKGEIEVENSISAKGQDFDEKTGSDQHVEIGDLSSDVRGGFYGPTPGFEEAMAGVHQFHGEGTVEDRIQAVKIGARLGDKFRAVLLYLNSIRNLQDPNVTVRVGYSRIAERAGVNGDYLRHKILPGLMMRGILSVVDKGLNGTVYRLEYPFSVISLIIGEAEGSDETLPLAMRVENRPSPVPGDKAEKTGGELPSWVDREHWSTLNSMMIERLVERAGSIERAQEILSILVYNETHGAEHMRVRNRLAVLTRYLQSRDMEIWPNDKGFETLAIRQAKHDVEEARQLKDLADQAIREKREAQLLSFRAGLTEEQMEWIRNESKTRVSNQPGQHLLKDKFVLYKAEEDSLIEEWMERAQYGEEVPTVSPQEE